MSDGETNAEFEARLREILAGKDIVSAFQILQLLDAKDARIRELEAALKPFAEQANEFFEEDPDDRKLDDLGVADVTIGHCRIARAALKERANG